MPDLSPVFTELHKILAPFASKLSATRDDEQELYVDTLYIQKNKKPLFFGAVQVKKSYVTSSHARLRQAELRPRSRQR